MRDFLEFLRRPKPSLPLIGFVLVLGTLGVLLLVSRLAWFELTPESRSFWQGSSRAGLFVPSPLEAYFLDTREELWPDRFNPKDPLRATEIPAFYTHFIRQNRWDVISPFELEGARQWSILANSQHLNELKALLKQPSSLSIRSEKECSPLMQETLYRISQVWPEYLKDIRVYFAGCAPRGIHLLWWEFQAALEKEDPESLRAIGLKFQAGMNDYPGQWSRWFALEAYQIAHVMAARFEERATKEP